MKTAETAGTVETDGTVETAGTVETDETDETAGTTETDGTAETAGTTETDGTIVQELKLKVISSAPWQLITGYRIRDTGRSREEAIEYPITNKEYPISKYALAEGKWWMVRKG